VTPTSPPVGPNEPQNTTSHTSPTPDSPPHYQTPDSQIPRQRRSQSSRHDRHRRPHDNPDHNPADNRHRDPLEHSQSGGTPPAARTPTDDLAGDLTGRGIDDEPPSTTRHHAAAGLRAVDDPDIDAALDAVVAAAPPLPYPVRARLAWLLSGQHHAPRNDTTADTNPRPGHTHDEA
jgi:hypothetical protein